jgi:hypothetical protein
MKIEIDDNNLFWLLLWVSVMIFIIKLVELFK